MTPQKAKSVEDLALLPFDNVTLSGDAWAMVDEARMKPEEAHPNG